MRGRGLLAAVLIGLPLAAASAATRTSPPGLDRGAVEHGAPVILATLAGTTWTFHDESGASFTVTFEPKGGMIGTMFSPSWRWDQDGNNVLLQYANRLGGQTTREGQLLSRTEMTGTGRSSRGTSWSWSAQRIR